MTKIETMAIILMIKNATAFLFVSGFRADVISSNVKNVLLARQQNTIKSIEGKIIARITVRKFPLQ